MIALIEIAFEIFYSFCVVFIMCELGERLIHSYSEIDDTIIQLDWYLFSFDIQKILPIIFMNSQKPVPILIFGSTQTKRETFQKVGYNYE